MHIMCYSNFTIQCIPLFHHSKWKTVFFNIIHTLAHCDLYMSSCTLLLGPHILFYLVRLVVPFPSVVLHMLGPLIPAISL
ncbi:hypothetical protein E2C01_061889 [Portunus trituberculatus]|uniref:Uncharacterized protein n=1 Tax=Portunus trituberculatus TaxID=210409 RepID=A0A5B7HFM4_PORTR|nr:hypothetical protein [Portunus trituberculatus]